jgi:hypothetical protein
MCIYCFKFAFGKDKEIRSNTIEYNNKNFCI